MGCSVRTDRYRYTEWRDWRTGKVLAKELYDHKTDPQETNNVIATAPVLNERKKAIALLRKQFPFKENGNRKGAGCPD